MVKTGAKSNTAEYFADPREYSILFILGREYGFSILFHLIYENQDVLSILFLLENQVFRNYPYWSIQGDPPIAIKIWMSNSLLKTRTTNHIDKMLREE